MQTRLEDVLGEKEKELKLYQRFLDLRDLCEQEIFPSVNLPLKEHVEKLKFLIERIIPDPRDRKEELFSGEIFALLGAVYLHDTGVVGSCRWFKNDGMFSALDSNHRRLLVSSGIGREIGIPEKAIEVINYLGFSDIARKLPVEWVITEGGKKAIIRNTKVIRHLFNFSHFLLDVFHGELGEEGLRRYSHPMLLLAKKDVSIEVSSREGIIRIGCSAASPYEIHQIERAKRHVENAFKLFKDNVNGRLGFQYRKMVWNTDSKCENNDPPLAGPVFPSVAGHRAPVPGRWAGASAVLDRLFKHGLAVVVGDESVGKSTMLKYFVLPQVVSIVANAFYCEVWENPVSEIREVICRTEIDCGYPGLDIISLCSRLLDRGPTLFVLDGFERTTQLDLKEREKLERFLDFCFARENCYIIVSGDKATFFEWSASFGRTVMSAIYELKPVEDKGVIELYGQEEVQWEREAFYTPLKSGSLHGGSPMESALKELFTNVSDINGMRAVLAVLIDVKQIHLRRYTVNAVCFETYLDPAKVLYLLGVLKEKGLVAQDELAGTAVFSLSNRYLKEPLFRILRLEEFEEKKGIRAILKQSSVNDSLLDGFQLDLIRKWKDDMIFSREGMGRILGSLISMGENYGPFLEKAKRDNGGVDIHPILKFLLSEDAAERKHAVGILLNIGDKKTVNPLLAHLKNEKVAEIRELIIRGVGSTGKKRRIIAVMRTLREIGDTELRLKAIGFFSSLPRKNCKKPTHGHKGNRG